MKKTCLPTADDYECGPPRKSNANGSDGRPYLRTNVGEMPGLPQGDEYEPGVVYWGGKRLYLGRQTQLRRLFHLLADHPGRWHPIWEIQEIVYELRTDASLDLSNREIKRAGQKLRRLVSRLKDRMREHGLDEHAIIVPHHMNGRPGYVLLLFQDQKYEEGQAPYPKLTHIERP